MAQGSWTEPKDGEDEVSWLGSGDWQGTHRRRASAHGDQLDNSEGVSFAAQIVDRQCGWIAFLAESFPSKWVSGGGYQQKHV
jgi:hypothetical protein